MCAQLMAEVNVGGIPNKITWDSTGHHRCAQFDNYISIVYEGPLKRGKFTCATFR
jgi:hypothetical protein